MGLVKTRRLAAMQKRQTTKAVMRPPMSKANLRELKSSRKEKNHV